MDAYLNPQTPGADFRWRCDNVACASTRVPMKTSNFTVCPQVFCVQLKRWSLHGDHGTLLHDVRCDPQLHIQSHVYHLRSIVAHIGATAAQGHYTCRMHCPTTAGEWWHYINSTRRLASPSEIETTTPVRGTTERSYLLLYEM
jgi:ubiquitin C-terminal hydrolase